eukprot:m.173515 g.173515  ORF g.173515 m.173515 type:complete len:419 (+) comp16739_c0_seq3:568-1824(+)
MALPLLLLLTFIHLGNTYTLPRLFLSFWVDPVVPPEQFDAQYALIAQANFTAILGGFGAKTTASVEAQLTAAAKQDLGVLAYGFESQANINMLSNSTSPALWGYQLKDEPTAAEFPDLRAWSDAVAAKHPGKWRFINLLPNYGRFNTSYGDYVRSFVAQVQPDVLCMDHYPRFSVPYTVPGFNNTRDGYRQNLELFREVSLAANIPFVNFFNTMPFNGGYRDPSEAQLRWQAFTALAYGAKGFLYFCYWTPAGFPLGGAIMTPLGNTSNMVPGVHYRHVKAINSHVLAYEKYLLSATSESVWFTGALANNSSPAPVDMIVQGVSSTHQPGQDLFLVGQFTLQYPYTTKGVLLQNHHDTLATFANVSFAADIALSAIMEVAPRGNAAGSFAPVLDDAPGTPGLQLRLAPGSARFLFLSQ